MRNRVASCSLRQCRRYTAPVVLLLGRENLHAGFFQRGENLGKARVQNAGADEDAVFGQEAGPPQAQEE